MKNSVFIFLAIAVSCTGLVPDKQLSAKEEEAVPEKADSIDVNITLKAEHHYPFDITIRETDLFIYDSEGTREMISHRHFNCRPEQIPPTVRLAGGSRSRIFVAICNFPYNFNMKALRQFDSMLLLSLMFQDEDPSAPVLSGFAEYNPCSSGDSPGTVIHLSPLMCTVTLDSVSNALDGYGLLENPQVYLSGCNPEAELLREKDFRPKEELEEDYPVRLPYDIGFYTQNPGTRLFCYPNDTPEDILGVSRTRIVFECAINGAACRFSETLPPFGRGSIISAGITVFSPDEALWEISPRYSPSQTQ